MNVTEALEPVLKALQAGPRDTMQIVRATGIPYSLLQARLQRLRTYGKIVSLGRRRTFRTMGMSYVMIWSLPAAKREKEVRQDPRIAGTIMIGRGSRWGAGRA